VIARIWRGAVRTGDADEYAQYIRDAGGETEFLTLSMWDSRDAIKAFAGEDIEAAVLYAEDEKYLVGESTIAHYDIVDEV
jgi:heme-degrading monooxygenase HmoA